jgi:hypothetical protein
LVLDFSQKTIVGQVCLEVGKSLKLILGFHKYLFWIEKVRILNHCLVLDIPILEFGRTWYWNFQTHNLHTQMGAIHIRVGIIISVFHLVNTKWNM